MASPNNTLAQSAKSVPTQVDAGYSYQPQCESCVAKTFCMGCTYPGCEWCYQTRCDDKRENMNHAGCDCAVSCKSHVQLDALLANCGGLYPGPARITQRQLALPNVLPIIDPMTPEYKLMPKWTYIIPISNFIRRDGTAPPRIHQLREHFPPGTQFILSFCVQDIFLTYLWNVHRQFWYQSWLDQFDAVLGVNFSVYWADPQMEIHRACRQMLVMADGATRAMRNVIPIVIWYTSKEAWPQLDLYVKNGITTICINFQYVTGAQVQSYKHDFKILEEIAAAYPFLRVICYGLAAPYVVDEARRILGRNLIIANGDIFYRAVQAPPIYKPMVIDEQLRRYTRLATHGADAAHGDFMRKTFQRPEDQAALAAPAAPADTAEATDAPVES